VITTFRTDEEAIAIANATEYGLVAAVVSTDLARAQRVADGFHSGVVHINDQRVVHSVYGPIGGVGASGNHSGHGTVSNADQFSEWQWITTHAQIPAYLSDPSWRGSNSLRIPASRANLIGDQRNRGKHCPIITIRGVAPVRT
jgi:hypothetical protein